ncbi:SDR family NAD(P)-dependent oxidoreductase [Prauserella flavalba]|uniref:3-oxoacyl-ACP reductase n=1 Tax=Prauserella flavalba TaxID=1477506 RepID=A0A318LQQ4_9PSEU|nr:SDR family oxidoreductase [Prauserella flavalba]PXY36836.1 3-oxoacyl-ACP reductase [Prauserella flavalba]
MTETAARTVLVTGGSRGIGAGITRELVARGRQVACGYRGNREAAEKLRADAPDRVLPVHYDLADAATATTVVGTVLEQFGTLDALILNAGTWNGGKLSTMDPLAWWRVVELNLGGVAALARAALPALRASGDPSIVIVSSVIGVIGHAGDTAYASAKAALIGFARSLAKETGRDGLRVNVLAPGFVDTDMTAEVSAKARDGIERATVLGRFGTVPEIARAAVFLSEDATYCTGSVLTADGGWSI